jgi:hypothetical protein
MQQAKMVQVGSTMEMARGRRRRRRRKRRRRMLTSSSSLLPVCLV